MAACITGALASCGQNANNARGDSSQIVEDSNKNPLSSISEDYQTGQSQMEIVGSLDETFFNEFANQYSEYIVALGNYMDLHSSDFENGKTFKDLDDYEDSFSEFYQWANQLIYFSGDVDEEYKEAWEKFQKILSHHIEVLDTSYSEESTTAINSIYQLTQYVIDEIAAVNELLPLPKVSYGSTIESEGFSKIIIKDVSYQTIINPSDTSGFYSYYEVQNTDNIYLAINFDFTNLKTEAGYNLDDYLTFEVTYEGGYHYTGWSIAEDSGRLTPYPNLLPLANFNSWYLIEVPKSLQNTPYTLTFTMNGTTYQVSNE